MENWRRFLYEDTDLDSVSVIDVFGAQDIEDLPVANTSEPDRRTPTTAQHPLKGLGRLSSKKGDKGNRKYAHNGQDISAPVGTEIYPLAEGVVISVRSQKEFEEKSRQALKKAQNAGIETPGFIDNDLRLVDFKHKDIQKNSWRCPLKSYRWVQKIFKRFWPASNGWHEGGIWVMIKHPGLLSEGKEITAWYAHLHDLKVSVGDKVNKDTIIGTVGRSGVVCNQPHLHLEMFTGKNTSAISGRVRPPGKLINPIDFLPRA